MYFGTIVRKKPEIRKFFRIYKLTELKTFIKIWI